MALRIRKDGRIFCAALASEEPGDTYIDELRGLLTELIEESVDKPPTV